MIIRVCDVETTGFAPPAAAVVELAYCDLRHDEAAGWQVAGGSAWFCDPGHPIPPEVSAIHHIVEARRVELRHGTLALVRATFQGFAALPAPDGQRHWSEVLQLPRSASRDAIDAAYRDKAKRAHPDAGGSVAAMAALNAARDAALKEIGG